MANELSLLMGKKLIDDEEIKNAMKLGQAGKPTGASGVKLPFQSAEASKKEESAAIAKEAVPVVGAAPAKAVNEITALMEKSKKELEGLRSENLQKYETQKAQSDEAINKAFDDYSSKTAREMTNSELFSRIIIGIAPQIIGAVAGSEMGIGYGAGGFAGGQAGLSGLKALDDAQEKLNSEKEKIGAARAKAKTEAEKDKLDTLGKAVTDVNKELAQLPGIGLKGQVEVATGFPEFSKRLAEAATPKVIIQQGGEGGFKYSFPPQPRAAGEGDKSALEKAKSSQFAAGGFAVRAKEAEDVLNMLQQEGFDPASASGSAQRAMSGSMLRTFASENAQLAENAEKSWILAVVRDESGAAIKESEWKNYRDVYFPVFGDTPEVVEAKRRKRILKRAEFEAEAGPDVMSEIYKLAGEGAKEVSKKKSAPTQIQITPEIWKKIPDEEKREFVNPSTSKERQQEIILKSKGVK